MENNFIYELIGYAASLLVVISLMMSAIVKLRVVNMIGAFAFAVYGILIGAIPVAVMNGIIVFVNIYYLFQIYRDDEFFQLLEVDEDSSYTRSFLQFYKAHVVTNQPAYTFDMQRNFSLFVLRDMVPAGLVQGNIDADRILTIDLDFVIPNYRDFKIGRYLFKEKLDFFRSKNIRAIRASSGSEAHNRYLLKAGFMKSSEERDASYVIALQPDSQ
ncbi:MAG: GNAT family N-acetyltransferase [Puniceicoccaceae bacterium]